MGSDSGPSEVGASAASVAPAPRSRISEDWARLLSSRGRGILWGVAGLNLLLALLTYFVTFGRHLNSGDEYAYLVSAEIFARGRLSVPSPALKEFFDVVHVVNDGRFYGKYPPGWPLLLGAGVLLGIPWIVNPLIGAATLAALHRFARRHFSLEAANLACLLLLGNPFLVFNSASYFSHGACLLFCILALDALFEAAREPRALRPFATLGASAGAAFLIRPFTTVVLLTLPSLYLLLQLRKPDLRRLILRGLPLALALFLVFAGLLLAYNRAQTGNPFLQPFQKYASWDAPSFPKDTAEFKSRAFTHGFRRLLDLGVWLPLSPILILLALGFPRTRRDPRLRVLMLMFASLFIAFFFYWGGGIVQYGPRYLYEALGAIIVVSALSLQQLGPRAFPVLLGILIFNTVVFVHASDHFGREISGKRNLYTLIEERRLQNALVFVRTGSGNAPIWDCPRNGIDFSGPVLFVLDRGIENERLMEKYPERTAYYYEYVASRGKGYLTPVKEGTR